MALRPFTAAMDAAMAKPDAIIVDMDGTLANVSSIRHYVKRPRNEKDFDSFHKASIFVPPNKAPLELVKHAHADGLFVFVVTARKSMWEQSTRMWLAKHKVPYDALCMRGNKDSRKDVEVKKDILGLIRATHRPVLAIDDNPSIIDLWSKEGIMTYVVPGWEKEDDHASVD